MPAILSNLACCFVALMLVGLAPSAAMAANASGAIILAQATDGDEDADDTPRRRGAEEADADDAPAPAAAGGGASTLDIMDAAGDVPKGLQNTPKDAVVCLAGCDGPRGIVVYRKPRP